MEIRNSNNKIKAKYIILKHSGLYVLFSMQLFSP